MNGLARAAIVTVLSACFEWAREADAQYPAPSNYEPLQSEPDSVLWDSPLEPEYDGPVSGLSEPGEPNDSPLSTFGRLGSGGVRRGMAAGGPGGPMGAAPGYEATWYPSQAVSRQAADLGLVRQSLGLGAPIWRTESDMVLLTTSVRNSLFATDAVLPDSLRPFPDELWSVSFGLNYFHQFENGRSAGIISSLGSASDQPFYSIHELTAMVGAFYRLPAQNERDAWTFGLLYMYGGQLDFPVPILSYAWNPSEQLQVNLGLPFSVAWNPTDALAVNFSYFPLNNVNARLTYRLAPQLQFYTGYEYRNETYFLTDRDVLSDRFFFFEQRLIAGIGWDLWKYLTLDANAGYSFGRHYGEGDSQWGTLTDRVDVNAGPFLGVALRLRF